ncbi:hypothetical protein [Thalassolituus maritimus]|uniref:Uncharacterized protein n=1 Tax=Thalassolituus maritimus TaxID=484498 RepID=A0ABQ0A0V0_9GAMM
MFLEIKFKPDNATTVNALSGTLSTFANDAWRNNPLNRFIVLGLSNSSLKLVLDNYGEDLSISYNPIDISDPSLSAEERSWMKNLLETREYILSVGREFDKK